MSSTPQPIRGTQSLIGEDADRFHAVIAAFDRVRRLYGFKRVEVPVIEPTAVFARTMGETTDVVSKEMYSFDDKSGESITLRPEFTAGIARAFLSEGWQQYVPLKVATHGPAFRYERPQKGRFRQFHQLDAEIIGSSEPQADVELLSFADQLLNELGLKDKVRLELNTLGDAPTRDAWRGALVKYFSAFRGELSDESLLRLESNPLRILDSKDPGDRALVASAPSIDDFMSVEAGQRFAEVVIGLERAGVRSERNRSLVRGLDYYRHTAFEFVTDQLGAQGTVLAGGRYDGLMEQLGGPHTPAVGWAAGIERLAMLIGDDFKPTRTAAVVIESDLPALENIGNILVREMRKGRMAALLISDGSIKKRYEKAVKLGADYIIILEANGDDSSVGTLRLRRRIADRYGTRGRVYVSLKNPLANLFGVDTEEWRNVTRRGGELVLKARQ